MLNRIITQIGLCTFLFNIFFAVAAAAQLDQTFANGGKIVYLPMPGGAIARRVRIQPDGKIVTFGTTTVWQGNSFLSRHSANGILDPNFAGDGIIDFDGGFNDMEIVANGNILLTGDVPSIFAGSATGFRTYDSFGNLIRRVTKSSWDDTPGRRLLVQQDGKIVVVTYTGTPNFAANHLAAIRFWDTAEFFDNSFGGGFGGMANSGVPVWADTEFWNNLYAADFLGDAAIQSDGKIVMIGSGSAGTMVVRLTTTGAMDGSFGGGGIASLPSGLAYTHPGGMVIQSDGKIVINGVFAEFGLYSSFIVRFNADGTLDQQFGSNGLVLISEPDPEGRGIGTALAIEPNGKIITAGDRGGQFALMRFTSSGMLDTSFGNNGVLSTSISATGRSSIHSLAWQSPGKLLAVGTVDETTRSVGIARYDLNDTLIRITGRVITPGGAPLRNAVVTLIAPDGSRRTTTSGSFGLFAFDNVTRGASFTLSVSSRRYRFAPRSIQPTSDLAIGDLVGLE